MMQVDYLATCPLCRASCVGFSHHNPPAVYCTECSYTVTGCTYESAVDQHTRRGGNSRHHLVCDSCGYQTSVHYHADGQSCLCGGTLRYARIR